MEPDFVASKCAVDFADAGRETERAERVAERERGGGGRHRTVTPTVTWCQDIAPFVRVTPCFVTLQRQQDSTETDVILWRISDATAYCATARCVVMRANIVFSHRPHAVDWIFFVVFLGGKKEQCRLLVRLIQVARRDQYRIDVTQFFCRILFVFVGSHDRAPIAECSSETL